MKLATKLGLGFGTLLVLMAVINFIGLNQMSAINKSATAVSQSWLPKVVLAEEMNTAASDYRIQQVQHVIAQDAATMSGIEKELSKYRNEFERRAKEFDSHVMSPEGRAKLDEALLLWKQYMASSVEVSKISANNDTTGAMALLNGRARTEYTSMSSALLEFVELCTAGADAASAEGDEMYESAFMMVIVVVMLSTIFGIGVAVYIVRDTLRLLGRDPRELGLLAKDVAQGRLDIKADANAVGVYAEILVMVDNLKKQIENAHQESQRAQVESERAKNALLTADAASKEAQSKSESLVRVASKLQSVAHVVSSASTELAAQISQSERGASQQAAQVTETAAAMNEMNSTVIEVARNASNASDASAQTRHRAEVGAKVVREAVDSIQGVQNSSLALKQDMQALSEQAQSISQIMNVISDIADQTNLLALNAAIEAARAGDAGRGFAVVADEVRNLAEKTMTSTTDVGNAIKAIQDSATKSMLAVDSTVANIEKATELASRSGEALTEIVIMVDNSADQVRAIATASEQQSASSEEINRSIVQVNRIASETAMAMQQATQAVSDLAAQAQTLSGLVEEMQRG